MSRRQTPAWVWAVLAGLVGVAVAAGVAVAVWPEPDEPPTDEDTGMTEEQQRALLQEIGYLK